MTALSHPESTLPPIPNKRYFTIGEVGSLCDVKSHVLRYWEQEFTQLKPTKRRGNRRYYQRHDIELIRQIRSLLYEQGFTIAGARQQLAQITKQQSDKPSRQQAHDVLPDVTAKTTPANRALEGSNNVQTIPAEDQTPDLFTHLAPITAQSSVSPLTQIRQALERLSNDLDRYL